MQIKYRGATINVHLDEWRQVLIAHYEDKKIKLHNKSLEKDLEILLRDEIEKLSDDKRVYFLC
jgi:hypothetical protein